MVWKTIGLHQRFIFCMHVAAISFASNVINETVFLLLVISLTKLSLNCMEFKRRWQKCLLEWRSKEKSITNKEHLPISPGTSSHLVREHLPILYFLNNLSNIYFNHCAFIFFQQNKRALKYCLNQTNHFYNLIITINTNPTIYY